MRKTLSNWLKGFATEELRIDPSEFADPVAMETEWSRLKQGGANFQTHRLIRVDRSRMEFKASMGAKLFGMIFLIVGLGITIGFSVQQFSSGRFSPTVHNILSVSFGLLFAIAGGVLLYTFTAPIVFDRQSEYFWKGRKIPNETFDKKSIKEYAKLVDIHAIQLISECCRGNKSSYYSYELNLVLKDGKRVNVVDHGNHDKLCEDAEALSQFLERPVWNGIGGKVG